MKYELDDSNKHEYKYSTARIAAFTSGDDETKKMILQSFVDSTKKDLVLIKRYLGQNKYKVIQRIALKMLPLFKNLDASDVVVILEEMKHPDLTNSQLEIKGNILVQQTEELISTIQNDYNLH